MNFGKAWESYQLYRKYRGALASGFSPSIALSKAGKRVGQAMALAAVGAAVGVLNDSAAVKTLLETAGLNEAWTLLLTGAIGIIGAYVSNMVSEQTKYVESPIDEKPIDAKTARAAPPVTQNVKQWDALNDGVTDFVKPEIVRVMNEQNLTGPDGFKKARAAVLSDDTKFNEARAAAFNAVVGETVATQPQPAKVAGP